MNTILEIEYIKYHNLFDNLSFSLEKNTISIVSGSNNCGKTTLIRILNKNIKNDSIIKINNTNINDIKLEDYNKIVQAIIPMEIIFDENTLERELYSKCNLQFKEKEKLINFIVKGLKIKSILNKEINTLNKKEIIYSQIAISLINNPQILLIDNFDLYFTEDESKKVIEFLKEYKNEYDTTILLTTLNLDMNLLVDYLFIIDCGKIVLAGSPLEVLEKDNIINKIGLNIPFMIDMSVKLRDYDLLNTIETDYNKVIETLWN